MGISFVCWMMPLFLIIALVTFAKKDFDFVIIGGITGVYTGAVLVLMGVTAKVSYGKIKWKYYIPIHKRIKLNSMKIFRFFIKG
jgi:heat shock protein HtpX